MGYGWHDIGTGFVGPSDPFTGLVAVLGSITFWSPSTAIVLFFFVALPVSAIGAWLAARRVTNRHWVPAVAALVYSVSPPVLSALQTGHLGAVITHVALPFLVLAMVSSHRSWAAGATASILFAVVAAATPSLIPALVIGWLAAMATRPRGTHRMLGIPVPAIALFVPLAIAQISRGTWWAVFADPGVPTRSAAASPLQLALGSPETGLNGWTDLVATVGITGSTMAIVIVLAMLPLGILAALSVFAPSRGAAVACLAVALLGYASAVGATHLEITGVGSSTTGVWAGSGLSLYFAGLIGAASITLDRIPRFTPPFGFLLGVVGIAASVPLILATLMGTATIVPSSGRILSAYVTAEAVAKPDVGTLVLSPQPDGSLAVSLQRGQGRRSTSSPRSIPPSSSSRRRLVTSPSSPATWSAEADSIRSGISPSSGSDSCCSGRRKTTVRPATSSSAPAEPSTATPCSCPSARPRAVSSGATSTPRSARLRTLPGALRPIILITWAIVFGSALLLAIPTTPRRRRARPGKPEAEQPATTFDEERDD
ncbi:hypothetical protein GCM10025867_37350 [Frondihabitans sucicola]|uniref:Uncharacterized protein n=1 Tax=Frondihabitans sucicola TaxID=1268041 RepID=A0ABM8GSQ4_9MICO|nr:hypothetical protein [Frondihabitans sucicola]BDZ51494.1 hypothetical protein GCM10025867_37350 [Frondihabitans sucicola]